MDDPGFLDPLNNNFRLKPCSAAIDMAHDDYVPADMYDVDDSMTMDEATPDLDLKSRIVGGGIDMGAYELHPGTCVGDLDDDGVVNAVDLAILLGQWGYPGTGDLDCSGLVGAADLGILLGAWGDCSSEFMSASSQSESLTPEQLAEAFGFSSVAELTAYLCSLEFEEMQTLLEAYFGSWSKRTVRHGQTAGAIAPAVCFAIRCRSTAAVSI